MDNSGGSFQPIIINSNKINFTNLIKDYKNTIPRQQLFDPEEGSKKFKEYIDNSKLNYTQQPHFMFIDKSNSNKTRKNKNKK